MARPHPTLTPWYPVETKPCRVGWYMRRFPRGSSVLNDMPIGSAYWDGLYWFKQYGRRISERAPSLWQGCEWRGLRMPFGTNQHDKNSGGQS